MDSLMGPLKTLRLCGLAAAMAAVVGGISVLPVGSAAQSQKAIVVGMMFEPVSFNPLRGVDSGSYYASTLVYEGLVKYNEDLQLVPALAESFVVSDDGLTYTFKMRPNLKFSTGEALTTGDVKASFALAGSALSPFRSDYADIDTVTISGVSPGATQDLVVIKLKQRSQPFLSRMAEMRILPKRVIDLPDHGNKLLARAPIATGAYCLKRWETGLELVFERNPYYWGRPARSATIVWRIIPDRTVTAVALAKGEIDLAQVDGRMWVNYLNNNKIRTLAQSNPLTLKEFSGNRTIYLGFNMRHAPGNDALVRHALVSALDRTTMVRVFYSGYAFVADTDTPRASWVYTPTAATGYDLNESSKTLQKAGYNKVDGVWSKDGKPLALRILTVKDLEDIADIVSDDLVRAGIKSEVEVIEYSTLRRVYLQKGRFDAVLWSRSCGPDPESTIVWSSTGTLNFCGLHSDQVDKILLSGRQAATAAERKVCYGQLQKYLANELPWGFLVQPKLLVAHKAALANVQKGRQKQVGLPWDNPLFNAADWAAD